VHPEPVCLAIEQLSEKNDLRSERERQRRERAGERRAFIRFLCQGIESVLGLVSGFLITWAAEMQNSLRKWEHNACASLKAQ